MASTVTASTFTFTQLNRLCRFVSIARPLISHMGENEVFCCVTVLRLCSAKVAPFRVELYYRS